MENGDITLTNREKAIKFLEEAGQIDCIPTTKPPLTKEALKAAMQQDTPLDEAGTQVSLSGSNTKVGSVG